MEFCGSLKVEVSIADRSVTELAASLLSSILTYFETNPTKYTVVLTVSIHGDERRLISSDTCEFYRPGYEEIVMRSRLLAGNAARILKKYENSTNAPIVIQSGDID